MAKPNPYAMDPSIMRGVSNLTRALLGSASDDAASARAKYYDAQTVGQKTANERDAQLAEAGANLAQNPQFQSVIAQAMGLNTMQPSFVGPPSSDTMRMGTPAANDLARTFLGEYGNAQQMANAADTYGGARSSRMAESMILGGSDDQAERGALMLKGGNKYNKPGFAMTELQADDATARRQDDMQYGIGGQGDRDTRAQEDTKMALGQEKNRNTRDVGMDKNARQERWEKYKTDVNAKVARDKNEAADATARYEIDNEPVEINVTPGKMIILDPTTAEKLNVPVLNDPNSKFNGLHVLDGGPDPEKLLVKVGKGNVHLTKEHAEILNIKPNADGQYIIPGAGYSTTSSGSGSGFTIAAGDNKQLTEVAAKAAKKAKITNIPEGVILLLVNQAASPSVMGNKKNMAKGTAHINAQLRKGYQEIVVPNTGTLGTNTGLPLVGNDTVRVPLFFTEQLKSSLSNNNISLADMRARPALRNQFVDKLIQVGYTDVQAAAIVDGME